MTDFELGGAAFKDYIIGIDPVYKDLANVQISDIVNQIYDINAPNKEDLVKNLINTKTF